MHAGDRNQCARACTELQTAGAISTGLSAHRQVCVGCILALSVLVLTVILTRIEARDVLLVGARATGQRRAEASAVWTLVRRWHGGQVVVRGYVRSGAQWPPIYAASTGGTRVEAWTGIVVDLQAMAQQSEVSAKSDQVHDAPQTVRPGLQSGRLAPSHITMKPPKVAVHCMPR